MNKEKRVCFFSSQFIYWLLIISFFIPSDELDKVQTQYKKSKCEAVETDLLDCLLVK